MLLSGWTTPGNTERSGTKFTRALALTQMHGVEAHRRTPCSECRAASSVRSGTPVRRGQQGSPPRAPGTALDFVGVFMAAQTQQTD